MNLRFTILAFLIAISSVATADDALPRSLDPRLTVELFAEQPQVRTPTGIDVDARGRVWVIESNTHFRPDDYDGHPTDRLLILTDTDGDGRCDDVQTFADGFTFAMSVAVRPVWMDPINVSSSDVAQRDVNDPQQVVLCTRHDIFLLEDRDRDDVCDVQTPLIHLETENRYPHNGLAGLAFDAEGWMYFGIGQNHGQPYRMISHEAVRNRLVSMGTQRNSFSPVENIVMHVSPTCGGEGPGIANAIVAPHPHNSLLQNVERYSVGERENAFSTSYVNTIDQSPLQVFLATRKELLLLEDTDGDDVCDRRTTLANSIRPGTILTTDSPDLAFDAEVAICTFGFGENLGEDYASSPAAQSRPHGRVQGKSASIWVAAKAAASSACVPMEAGLTRWSTGYWNPHASCSDAFGHLFTVDNDPDSRPPCRLIHVIEGGDSGYRFRNGRKGLHPFTAWNGEILGTLPMVAGTGEAPSGMVACEHPLWPGDLMGNLLVTSWGDHRIDRFQLHPHGGSFESIPEPLIVGGENFRPVGAALGPDGSLYCSDWVLKDYNLHGQGRVWRIRPVDTVAGDSPTEPTLDELLATTDVPTLQRGLSSLYLPARRLAARRLAELHPNVLVNLVRDVTASERSRFEALSASCCIPMTTTHESSKTMFRWTSRHSIRFRRYCRCTSRSRRRSPDCWS